MRNGSDFSPQALPTFVKALQDSGAAELTLRRGQTLFAQGARADALFYIRLGKVKITVLSEHGKEGVIGILKAGDFCGESCLAGETVRLASAEAMTDCVALRIERDATLQLLQQNTAFSDTVVRYLLARNMRIESDLIDQLFNSSEKRLARLLLILAGADKENAPRSVEPPISQEMLAEMIGTTRSRVSHFMNKFRQNGFISYSGHNGQLEVHKSLSSVFGGD
jgi:CRP/FNR family transcriptional regulator, cyclic AMP receptor protein